MADNNQTQAQAAADAPAKIANAIADTTQKVVAETAKVAKTERAKTARRAKRQATVAKSATRKASRRAKTARRTINTAARKTVRATQQRIDTVTNNDVFKGFEFKGFDALPTFAPFQTMFAQANGNGSQYAERGQKVAQELTELARANVEAVVEAGRVASEGTRALTQDAVSTSREGFEKTADAIRALAEAKSPTEYLQLQGEFARSSFDRMVAEGSKITETMVKLAGEAFQPISNRATANAERFNTLVA